MKLNLILVLLLQLILFTNCGVLKAEKYFSERFHAYYNSWFDLIGVEVKCPNDGVMKNFVLRKDGTEYYFELQCYSSSSPQVDNGEPIVKDATLVRTLETNLMSQKDIITLNSFTMKCSPEYSLNSFKIFIERNDYGRDVIKKVDNCKPHKASYVSKVIHRTEEKNGDPNSLDCFVDILVGSTEEENEQDVAFTLRGFKFMVEGYRYLDEWYNYSNKRKCYYLYSYAKIKNMEKFKEERLKKFEELRNKNTQAD